MKRKLFSALMSLAAIVGLASPNLPQVSLNAQGPVGVLPREEYTFTISYRYTKEMVVTINGIEDDNIWLWSWEEDDPDWRTEDFTDDIPDYEMFKTYVVKVTNDYGQDQRSIVYFTPGYPFLGR